MEGIRKYLKCFEEFYAKDFARDKERYKELETSQSPELLIIGCADSRLMLGSLFRPGVGEVFTLRNMGNIIPPKGYDDSTLAGIEYALCNLGIKEVAIVGHSNCNAIKGVFAGVNEGTRHIKPWLAHFEPLIRFLPYEGNATAIEHQNIKNQIVNLKSHDFVKSDVNIYGLYYVIPKGKLMYYNEAEDNFEALN